MPDLLKDVRLASEISPALNNALAGKRIERVEWHDSHGDVIVLHMEDKTKLRVTTRYSATMTLEHPDDLHLTLTSHDTR